MVVNLVALQAIPSFNVTAMMARHAFTATASLAITAVIRHAEVSITLVSIWLVKCICVRRVLNMESFRVVQKAMYMILPSRAARTTLPPLRKVLLGNFQRQAFG